MRELARGATATDSARPDTAGFEQIYAHRWSRVFAYAWVLVHSYQEAEDVASDTYLRAYAAWLAGRGPDGEALPWLFLIARRQIIDRSRRRRLVAWLPLRESHDHAAAHSAIDDSEVAVWFGQIASALTDRQGEALLLRYQFDLDDRQIGEIMGISAGGARTLVSRAVSALRIRPEVWR